MWKWEVTEPKGVFVIVHGAGEHHVRYKWVVERLNALNYHVIMGDLPGQGKTEGPRGHISSFDQYKGVVEKWLSKGREYGLPVILLGHSMGGLISICTLMSMKKNLFPDVVVLSSPCLGLAYPPSKSKRALSHILNVCVPQVRFPSGTNPGTRCEKMRMRDSQDPLMIKKVSVRWYRELVKAMEMAHKGVSEFPNIPLLVTQGGDDLIVDKYMVQKWFKEVPLMDKYYKEWDQLYHEVLNEPEKERVLAHIMGFVTIQLTMLK
ncbi:lysophospholipase [Evansella vedderi]|uniref:Lysophospholipase n=1 Tax=Evansella vedderi TaxID=38282 RepID=A0ABT9ZW31_9BACI|nr:alpha/beta hydrolase [Evansella vedderi]MDQ0254951.1 lysophospholipase [Evansella vedderi]